jgi:hypothetical protein
MRNWMPSDEATVQTAHVAISMAVVWMFPAVFRKSAWWGGVAAGVFAIWKELCWDLLAEGDNLENSLVDLAFYFCGIAFALLLWKAFRKNGPG